MRVASGEWRNFRLSGFPESEKKKKDTKKVGSWGKCTARGAITHQVLLPTAGQPYGVRAEGKKRQRPKGWKCAVQLKVAIY